MLIASITYCPKGEGGGKDLGLANNRFFERCLGEDDWGLILDHDLTITTPGWRGIMAQAIAGRPDAGCFTVKLNKACPKSRWQVARGVCSNNHDLLYHQVVGQRESAEKPLLVDVTENEKLPGGFALSGTILMRKAVWRRIGGFPSGALFVDWGTHERVRKAGLRVYLLNTVYAYHWGKGKNYPSI